MGLSDDKDPKLDNRLTDGGKVVSRAHWPQFTPQKCCLLLVLIYVRGRMNPRA
jgi:hypothetical protein